MKSVGVWVEAMLLRAYRITDRFGVAFLKSCVAVCTVTLDGLTVVRKGVGGFGPTTPDSRPTAHSISPFKGLERPLSS